MSNRKRIVLVAVFGSGLTYILLAFILTISPVQADDPPDRVGVVVGYGDGRVDERCAEFSTGDVKNANISGFEVLQQSGLNIEYDDSFDGNNVSICRIENQGCPADDCLCQCDPGQPAQDCFRWSVWRLDNNQWQPLQKSIAYYYPEPDEVHAWVWGNGRDTPADKMPPVVTLAEACNLTINLTPTATTPNDNPSPSDRTTSEPDDNSNSSDNDDDSGDDDDGDSVDSDLSGIIEAVETQQAADRANATGTANATTITGSAVVTGSTPATVTALPATEIALLASPTFRPATDPPATPLPTASATATQTPAPTSTPLPLGLNFEVDSTTLLPGQCTRLRWDMKNSEGLQLNGEALPQQGTRQLCPTGTQTYHLNLFYDDEWLNLPLTIQVSPPTLTLTASPTSQSPELISTSQGTPIAELWTPDPSRPLNQTPSPDFAFSRQLEEVSTQVDTVNPAIFTYIGCLPLGGAFGLLMLGIGGVMLYRWLKVVN